MNKVLRIAWIPPMGIYQVTSQTCEILQPILGTQLGWRNLLAIATASASGEENRQNWNWLQLLQSSPGWCNCASAEVCYLLECPTKWNLDCLEPHTLPSGCWAIDWPVNGFRCPGLDSAMNCTMTWRNGVRRNYFLARGNDWIWDDRDGPPPLSW